MDISGILAIIDTKVLIGIIVGAICGFSIGRNVIYTNIVKSNQFGMANPADDPYNQLDSQTRVILGLIGALFFLIGVILVFVLFTADLTGKENIMALQVGGFAFTVIGGLVLVPAISGKRTT